MLRHLIGLILIVLVLSCTSLAVPPGLVGYWMFDEGGGQVALDSSGNGLDGTLNGDPQWVAGQLGGALDFDGSGDYVEIPHDPLLSITDEITIAAWTNMRANASGEMAIVSKGGWGANDLPYELTETAGDVIFWQFYDDAGRDTCAPESPPVGEWHHIAGTYDGNVFKCYIDGELADEWAYAGTMPENTASVMIGRRSRGGTHFNGMIDDVAIYDRALDEGEIQSVMQGHLAENPFAHSPGPRDGAMLEQTFAELTWQPGIHAALHDIYFGESLDAVSAATPEDTDVFVGRQPTEILPVGSGGGPVPDALVPGTTYYWRVDEVNDAEPNSPWKGNVWSFWIRPLTAFSPFPPDGMKYVDPEQDLTWQGGMGVIFHKVFFGESYDEVNGAVNTTWMSTQAILDPGPLELDKTYYWRVDEFTQTGDQRGAVWSFTTRGEGGGVKAEYFDGTELAGDPVLAQIEPSIDHSWGNGEVASGLSDQVSARWRANLEAPFSESFRLITTSDDGVRLWLDDRLVIDNWTDHGTTDDTARVDLIQGQVYLIRMEFYENGGGAVAQLSWQSPTIPRQIVPQGWLQLPHWATSPSPANAEPHAPQAPVLTWTAGDEATAHDVYFGEDAEAVANATPADTAVYRGQQAAGATSFNPGPLQWNKTYYWRVDEVNPAHDDSPWKGAVWSFTTADFIIVDDFESYTNEVGRRVFEVWVDGIGFTQPVDTPGNGTGAAVGHDIWTVGSPYYNGLLMEIDNVHGGYQAMPVYYDNTAAPYRSEAERTWAAAQDWTVNGVDTVTLYVRGDAANGATPLYVVVEDSGGRSLVVTHPDDAIVTATEWTEWKIPSVDFVNAGVSLSSVKKMCLGTGGRNATGPSGAGVLYFDDIRVTRAGPDEGGQ